MKVILIIMLIILIASVVLWKEIVFFLKLQLNTPYKTALYRQRINEFECGDTVYIGDSHIHRSGLPGNQGIGNDVTNGVLHRLYKLKGAKVCYVEVGINDIERGVWQCVIIRNYRKIIQGLKELDIDPVIIEVLPVGQSYGEALNEQISRLNRKLRKLAKQEVIRMISMADMHKDGFMRKELVQGDGLHLNEAGYAVFKQIITK